MHSLHVAIEGGNGCILTEAKVEGSALQSNRLPWLEPWSQASVGRYVHLYTKCAADDIVSKMFSCFMQVTTGDWYRLQATNMQLVTGATSRLNDYLSAVRVLSLQLHFTAIIRHAWA